MVAKGMHAKGCEPGPTKAFLGQPTPSKSSFQLFQIKNDLKRQQNWHFQEPNVMQKWFSKDKMRADHHHNLA